MEGQSSGVFCGGLSLLVPAIATFVPCVNLEQRVFRDTFPFTWLGFQCLGASSFAGASLPKGNATGNACGSIPDADAYWGGAGDNWGGGIAVPNTSIGEATGTTTVTVSSPLNPGIGNLNVQIKSVSCPMSACAGYNGTFSVTASSSTNFVYTASSGLGTPTSAGTATLVGPSCVGDNPMSPTPTPGATCVDVDSTGLNITWISGPPFHDLNSVWNVGMGKTVSINNDGTSYPVPHNSMGSSTCSWPHDFFYPPGGCPTTLVLTTPVACAPSCSNPVPLVFGSPSIVRKNGDEMKEGENVLKDGGIIENVDNSGGQNGISTNSGVRQTSGGGVGQNYYSTITNATYSNLISRNTCTGHEVDGRSAGLSNGGGVSYGLLGLSFLNDLDYNTTNTNPGCNTQGFGWYLTSAIQTWSGAIACAGSTLPYACTFTGTASQDGAAPLEQQAPTAVTVTSTGPPYVATVTVPNGCTVPYPSGMYTTCFVPGETVAFWGTDYSWLNDNTYTVQSASASAVTIWVTSHQAGMSGTLSNTIMNGPVGFQVFDIRQGDPVYVNNCSNSSLDMPQITLPGTSTLINALGQRATASAQWALTGSWTQSNVIVTYPSLVSGSDPSGNCELMNIQDNPQSVTIDHVTLISDKAAPIGLGPTPPNHQLNHYFTNSILLGGGWIGSQVGLEGTDTEIWNYDTGALTSNAGSMTADYLVWPGRTYTNYTEYGSNPNYSDSSCTGTGSTNWSATLLGCNPPNTMYFPLTSYCTGPDPTYPGPGMGCVGFVQALNLPSGPMPLTLANYHGYQLLAPTALPHSPQSPFHNMASDGTDLGVIVPSLDTAQTTNLYVCTTPCGTGPFPDAP
jgi:hypothetical protein